MTGCEVIESLANDGVVIDIELMTVFEDQDGGGGRRLGVGVEVRGGSIFCFRGCCIRAGLLLIWRLGDRGDIGGRARSAAVEDGGTSLIVGIIVVGGAVVEDIRGVGYGNRIHIRIVVIRQRVGRGVLRIVVVRVGGGGRSPGGKGGA